MQTNFKNKLVVNFDTVSGSSTYLAELVRHSECRVAALRPEKLPRPGILPTLPDVVVIHARQRNDAGLRLYDQLIAQPRWLDARAILVASQQVMGGGVGLLKRDEDVLVPGPVSGSQLAGFVRDALQLPQRRHARIPVELMIRLFEYEDDRETPIRARTENVSSGGICARAVRHFDVGQRLRVIMNLGGAEEPLELIGVVRHQRQAPRDDCEYGIEFERYLYGDDIAFRESFGVPLAV